jgi:hypothetical protein
MKNIIAEQESRERRAEYTNFTKFELNFENIWNITASVKSCIINVF